MTRLLVLAAAVLAIFWYVKRKVSSSALAASGTQAVTHVEQSVPTLPTPVLGSQAQHLAGTSNVKVSGIFQSRTLAVSTPIRFDPVLSNLRRVNL